VKRGDREPARRTRISPSSRPAQIPQRPAGEHSAEATPLLAYLSVILLAAAVFAPTLTHAFVWDDLEQVRDNLQIRQWSSFWDYWHKDILALSRQGGLLHSNYYRPLFYVQYLFLYKLFGLHPQAWHAVAILMHALTCCAVLLFIRRLGLSIEISWAAALLFAVHPVHGESVSWIAAAFNDPPAAALLLLALTAHGIWLRGRGGGFLGLGALGYAGALCLKESGLSMLLLVPLISWFAPTARTRRERLLGFAPYLAVTFLYFVVRAVTIGTAFGNYEGTKSWAELAPTFPLLGVFYARLLAWPFQLSPSYPLRYVEGWSFPLAWGSLLALAVLGAALGLLLRRRKVLQFSALWIVCCVWPVFNIRSFLPTYLAHQRYLYLASLGMCLAIAWALSTWVRGVFVRRGILVALLLIWSVSDLYHDRFWATDAALWSRICEIDPKNPAGFDWLGSRAMDAARDATAAGRRDEARVRLDEAESLFRRSIAADPEAGLGYYNLAVLFHTRRSQPALALPLYEQALEKFRTRRTGNLDDTMNLRLNHAGCLAELGRREEALKEFLDLADSPPYSSEAAEDAAVLYLQGRRPDLVEAVLSRALSRNQENAGLLRKMANFYALTGHSAEATEFARRLAIVAPGDPTALSILRQPGSGAPSR
jgi:tetratricopeptide (TPR) repeat protein